MRILYGIGSRAKRFFLSSTGKEKTSNGEDPVGKSGPKCNPDVDSGFCYMGSDFGSKEESFFDSRAWLDSDCEDDFYSVNGDFTPSRGSTPNNQVMSPARPQWNKSLQYPSQFPDSKSEPSPTDGKKKLFDLLQENFQVERAANDHAETNGKLDGFGPPGSSDGIPYRSGTNSELGSELTTPGRDFSHRKMKTKSCCFPGLRPSRSFNDSGKQRLSPAH